jgi:hypothetical protein
MNMQEIRSLAKHRGVKSSRLSKIELVQAIQNSEGNFDCFATAADGYCDQPDCRCRVDCFDSAKKLKQ